MYGREYRCTMPTYYYISLFDKFDKRREQTFQTAWCRIPDNWNNEPDYSDTLLIRTLDVVSDEYVKSYEDRGIMSTILRIFMILTPEFRLSTVDPAIIQ